MTSDTGELILAFNGTKKYKDIATQMFNAMRARGAFMSDNAAIRVPVAALAEFLGETEKNINSVVEKNAEVFVVETDDEGVSYVITTRVGRAPLDITPENVHDLQERLMTPEPKPAPRPRPVREVVRTNEGWSTFVGETMIPDDEEDEAFGFAEPADEEIIATEPAAEAAIADVLEPEPIIETPAPEPVIEDVVSEAAPVADEEEIPARQAEAEPISPDPVEPVEDVRPEIPVFEEVVATPTPARQLGDPTDFSDADTDALAEVLEHQFPGTRTWRTLAVDG